MLKVEIGKLNGKSLIRLSGSHYDLADLIRECSLAIISSDCDGYDNDDNDDIVLSVKKTND